MPEPHRPHRRRPSRRRVGGLAPIVAAQLLLLGGGLLLCLVGANAPGLSLGAPLEGTLWGLTGTALLIAIALGLERRFPKAMADIDRATAATLRAARVRLTPPVIVLLSTLAGIGEEIAFRAALIDGVLGSWPVPLAAATSAVLFGLLHARTVAYALVATLIGGALTALYLVSGGLLAPMLAHTLYDVWAFRDLARKIDVDERDGPTSTLAA